MSEQNTENFSGKAMNMKQRKKLQDLQEAAKRLQSVSAFRCDIKCEDPDPSQPNCIVGVQFASPVLLMNLNERNTLAEMILLADDFVTTYIKSSDSIRFSFGVRGIWEE